MALSLIKADKDRKKWQIRGTLSDGTFVKIPAHRDYKVSQQILKNIELLDNARRLGETPAGSLAAWINALTSDEVSRLVKYKLLDPKYAEKKKPAKEHVEEFFNLLSHGCSATSTYPKHSRSRLNTFFGALAPDVDFANLPVETIQGTVKKIKVKKGRRCGQLLSEKSVRDYYSILRRFGNWLAKTKRIVVEALSDLDFPAKDKDPVVDRRPLSTDEFRQLIEYVKTAAVPSDRRFAKWLPVDRMMLYWAAVMTAFRKSELRKLKTGYFNFAVEPATVMIPGKSAKSGWKATIPLPPDFVGALKVYFEGKDADEQAFPMASDLVVQQRYYDDLDGAGINRQSADGQIVDFHALRCTAITWWLTENCLSVKEVQFMARLSTVNLVSRYSRNFKPQHQHLIEGSAKVVPDNLEKFLRKAAS